MPRKMTMLSLQPEDLTRLDKLANAAGLTRSAYIRTLLRIQDAKFEGREDELRIMSDRENKESPSGNEEGGQGSEARFLTKKIPNIYLHVKIKDGWYWMLFKNPEQDYFDKIAAEEEVRRRGFDWVGWYDYLTPEELLKEIEEEKQIVHYEFPKVEIRKW